MDLIVNRGIEPKDACYLFATTYHLPPIPQSSPLPTAIHSQPAPVPARRLPPAPCPRHSRFRLVQRPFPAASVALGQPRFAPLIPARRSPLCCAAPATPC